MDQLRRADQLLQWTEQQQLNSDQLQQAAGHYALQPAPDLWLMLANRVLLFAAVVLLSSALIFFIAYNWSLMHYFAKFALAGAAVLTAGTVAFFSKVQSLLQRAALLAAALMSGALLALIGQTYQTGADIWQLFASWALLITPLVLLSASRACYLLWFLLLQLALSRYLSTQSEFFWLLASPPMILNLALANLLILLFAEFALPGLGVKTNQALVWFAALLLIAPLTYGAAIGTWDSDYRPNLLAYLLLTALLLFRHRRQRRDVLILALLVFSAITVATSMLASVLENADEFVALNLLALFVIGSSAGAVIWLKKLLQAPAETIA